MKTILAFAALLYGLIAIMVPAVVLATGASTFISPPTLVAFIITGAVLLGIPAFAYWGRLIDSERGGEGIVDLRGALLAARLLLDAAHVDKAATALRRIEKELLPRLSCS